MLVVIMAGNAGYGIVQMSKIGGEIFEIAEHDLPLTETITKITTHQLEQAIALERSLRYGEEMQTDSEKRELFEETDAQFQELAELVDAEFVEAEHMVAGFIAEEEEARELKEFRHVEEALKEIDKKHATYEEHARGVLDNLRRGNLHEALQTIEDVEAEETALDKELEDLLIELEEFTLASARTAEAHEQSAIQVMIGLGVVGTIIAIIATLILVRVNVTRPLGEVVRALRALAGGDLTATVEVRSRDEIGMVARAFLVFKERMIENEDLRKEQAEAEKRQEEERRLALVAMADQLETTVKGTVDIVSSSATELETTAQNVSAMAEQASTQAQSVATASSQATANVQTVATAAEELSASIAEIGRQVNQSAKISQNASEEAHSTNQTVQGLAEATDKIGEVVNLINDIAGQTNLLALNATIEAARAGEAGKGFAVVAQEVKNLANQTAKATEEISSQIGAVQEETQGAVSAIEKIRSIIGEISDISTTIASAVEEQGVSTQEIARNVQQAASGTQEVNTNITGVSDAVSGTGASANQVLQSSSELSKQAERLGGEFDTFLSKLRAG